MSHAYESLFGDPNLPFAWDLTNWPAAGVGMHICGTLRKAIKEQFSDLADMFPFLHGVESKVHLGQWYICASLLSIEGTNTGGEFDANEIKELEDAAECGPLSYEQVVTLLPSKWFSSDRFTYIGPYRKPFGCWPHLVLHLNSWLQQFVLPDVLERNQRRVQRVIPVAPRFDPLPIVDSLWVLESEEASTQGTGFRLDGVGFVTNAHVLYPDTHAFRATDPSVKWPVRTIRRDDVIDLSVFEIDSSAGSSLRRGSADELKLMDHLLVAGFPNYRLGDSGYVAPGLVTGFRMVSAIRRILTNAPIIAGNSGGPVVGADGRVCGVAVTGAPAMIASNETENHGIIPIDALRFL